MTGTRRRSYETGHKPKYLVIVDGTVECDRAIVFATRRASRIGGGLVMLAIVDDADFHHWLGVGQIMREEAEEAAMEVLEKAADRSRIVAGVDPEKIVRSGNKAEQIAALINEDEDIAFLVLAASAESDGPGPLVSLLANSTGTFPVPVVIVPGDMSDENISALA
ncbi:MAG: universal stress protein [Beijerinckiaceae bacterium]|jgi:hypothetical protein|nr:universal stress protein [Beijerinckiaceae bacterium]